MSDFPYLKIKHYINGAWKEETGVKTEPLYNPSTGEVIGEVPMASSELAKEAIATADEAYKTWSKLPVAKRMTYIYKIRQGMVDNHEKLARAIAYDQAKHISEARGEVQRVIEILESAACVPSTIQGEYLDQVANNISARVIKQSLGVFGGVAPFNFPALVFGWFIPYAIAAGNTFIFKPSTQSPYFMQIMCEIFMETGLPAGVVNVIHGRRDIAESWYDDSRIAGVCLVGSTPTAKKMAEGCARGAKRSMLLGGAKNMLLVMEDANMDVFITNYLNSCYGSAGQRCLAGSIVAAVPEIYDEVLERMIEAAKTVKVGDAFDPDVYMGPLISQKAVQNVHNYIDIALKHGQGCQLVLDGRNPAVPDGYENGYFVGPTIFDHVTEDMTIGSDEVFGPVLCIKRCKDFEDGLAIMNANPYANGSVIYTQSGYYARQFARYTDGGQVGINVGIPVPVGFIPFSGHKKSFFGDLHCLGKDAYRFFTESKSVTQHWFDEEEMKAKEVDTWDGLR